MSWPANPLYHAKVAPPTRRVVLVLPAPPAGPWPVRLACGHTTHAFTRPRGTWRVGTYMRCFRCEGGR